MQGTLIVTILTVQSSYIDEVELHLVDEGQIPDTVQWWLSEHECWRIRTFSIDKDIHTYLIGNKEDFGNTDIREMALANDEKNYGDVIASQNVIELADVTDVEQTDRAFAIVGLDATIEFNSGRLHSGNQTTRIIIPNPSQSKIKSADRPATHAGAESRSSGSGPSRP